MGLNPLLVLTDNTGYPGRYRKEAHITETGIVIAVSQQPSIDLMFGRQLYDHHSMYITADEMEKLVEWWQSWHGGVTMSDK